MTGERRNRIRLNLVEQICQVRIRSLGGLAGLGQGSSRHPGKPPMGMSSVPRATSICYMRDMTALTPAPRPMVVHGKQNDFRR